MSERPWVTGDALWVAMQLRGLQPGDEVIPWRSAQANENKQYEAQFVDEVCIVDKSGLSVGLNYPEYKDWWVVRRSLDGNGIWITPNTIKAWRPKQ